MIATSAATQRVRGIPQSEALHVVERFTPVDANTIMYRVTVDDKNVYTKPWTVRVDFRILPDEEPIEFICNENEKSSQNYDK